MIYFITNKKHNVIDVPDRLQTLSGTTGIGKIIDEYIIPDKVIKVGFDYETTGTEPLTDKVLLLGIGNKVNQYVIDCTSVNPTTIIDIINDNCLLVGHNMKFEYCFTKTNYNIQLKNIYDTMIADQRLFANMFDPITKPFALDSVIKRYKGYIPHTMVGDIRKEFVGANPNTFIFSNRHIEYNAGDVNEDILDVRESQLALIKRYSMEFLINDIEFPLISILGEAELEGLDLNVDKLREVIAENKKIQFKTSVELDEIFRQLRIKYVDEKNRPYISNGIYDAERKERIEIKSISLFEDGEVATVSSSGKKKPSKTKPSDAFINWGSADEIIFLIGKLGFPVPTKDGRYVIPLYDEKNKMINRGEEFTTGEKALEQYIIDNPNSPIVPFFNKLIEYREANTELSKYGEAFLDKISPVTNKIHTSFRQTTAVNGRLQSGGGKDNQSARINIQNIPVKKAYRNSFYSEGYKIITCDYSGCEVTIMADKANDQKLFELAMKGDIHSYVIQAGWRAIFASRKDWDNAENYIVSKTINSEVRRFGKNLTFGGFYGCGIKKAAKTINCSREEGGIYLNVQRSLFPKTYAMVDANADRAIRQGFLVFNSRTNSRIWFPKVIESIRNRSALDFMDQIEADGQARNTPISGTNADMIKESMVEIHKIIRENKIPAKLLMQVHDELVYAARPDIAEVFGNEVVKATMINVANKYLTNIKMDCSIEIADYWTK